MSIDSINLAETLRKEVSAGLIASRKAGLGQFMTPASVAKFMASLFPPANMPECILLDAGAGIGGLTSAFIERCSTDGGLTFKKVRLDAYEIDASLRKHLERTLSSYASGSPIEVCIHSGDFIEAAALQNLSPGRYTHAILNPPYKKINNDSLHRQILRQVGIETVNLYTAFVALALDRMQQGGQVVAIIPRSFCNGPYYKPFREFVLKRASICHLHLFDSRSKAFKDDDVLQENVIIRLERGGIQGRVQVSHSTDDRFADLTIHECAFEQIVFPEDIERFIHIPSSAEQDALKQAPSIQHSLRGLNVEVSTGPIVDFRLCDFIEESPCDGCVPLLYPGHFEGLSTHWPKEGIKRGNAIRLCRETEKWMYPNGFFTVVRRFSSKEEARRIVASVVRPDSFPGAAKLGFENHLNVFHHGKRGLPELFAYGLAVYLNSTIVDQSFRRFNGHTQVNATDLRMMKYPDQDALTTLGAWAKQQENLTQEIIDFRVKKLLE